MAGQNKYLAKKSNSIILTDQPAALKIDPSRGEPYIGGEICLLAKSARTSRVNATHSTSWAFVISLRTSVLAQVVLINTLVAMIKHLGKKDTMEPSRRSS
jgi:hypothetical protein